MIEKTSSLRAGQESDGTDPVRAIFDASPLGFLAHDKGRIVYANEAVARIFGYRPAEMRGMDLWSMFSQEEVPRLKSLASARARDESVPHQYETTAKRRDGNRCILEFTVRYGLWEGQELYHAFVQDRTVERDAERALADSERRFRDLIDGSIQGFFIHRDFEILYANRAAAEIFGYDPDSFVGISFESRVHPDFRGTLREYRRLRLLGGPAPDRYEFLGLKRDGEPVWIEVMSRVVEWRGREAIQSTIIDITKRKDTEVSLRRAKEEAERASRAKTEFLANMSHELRTPLNAIIGFSQLIRDAMVGPLLDRYTEYAGSINSSGEHLLELINDLLDVAAIEAGEIRLSEEFVDLGEAIESCARMLRGRAHRAGLTFAVEVPDDAPCVRGDGRRIKQILINVMGNAVKFTPAGGNVSVRLTSGPAGGAMVEIADTGIGIAASEMTRVFDPFARVDHIYVSRVEGTGLGLPLVKSLANLMEIGIDLQSTPNVGTTMRLMFPESRIIGGK